jgi:hypothetical protein
VTTINGIDIEEFMAQIDLADSKCATVVEENLAYRKEYRDMRQLVREVMDRSHPVSPTLTARAK